MDILAGFPDIFGRIFRKHENLFNFSANGRTRSALFGESARPFVGHCQCFRGFGKVSHWPGGGGTAGRTAQPNGQRAGEQCDRPRRGCARSLPPSASVPQRRRQCDVRHRAESRSAAWRSAEGQQDQGDGFVKGIPVSLRRGGTWNVTWKFNFHHAGRGKP